MIKMILAIGHINYDKFLNNMLEMEIGRASCRERV